MKLQHLIIIFIALMLPMTLVMSQYINLQSDTLTNKTKYDTALLDATFDTMAAFELNTRNSSDVSSVVGEEIRDMEAVISTFTKSLSTSLGISGVSDDYLMSYVPAMIFGMYDGYYIYTPVDTTGAENFERQLKPYVYYTKTYTNGGISLTISYSLDNYVSIYAKYGTGKTISAAGYLVVPDDVTVSNDFAYITTSDSEGKAISKVISGSVTYKGYQIEKETLYENKAITDGEEGALIKDKASESTDAMIYYYNALEFTKQYNEIVNQLSIADQNVLEINQYNDPEDETSLFMEEKINIIKNSITTNLNAAIFNYEGRTAGIYEMPQLSGEDWEKILNNISITVFMKDIPIGMTKYNNYVVVNSTTNHKYVNAKAINFLEYMPSGQTSGYYHRITCPELARNIQLFNSVSTLTGYAAVDYERYKDLLKNENSDSFYYYKHNEYADYECEVASIENVGVATIEAYLDNGTKNYPELGTLQQETKDKLLKAYYTAVGRIRNRLVKASSYINFIDTSKNFSVKYNTNGGTWANGATYTVASQNGKASIISGTPRKDGFAFAGWSINPGATTAQIQPGDTLYYKTNGHTIELFAVYAQQYTITFDGNGSGVAVGNVPAPQTLVSGSDVELSSKKPTKEGYIFMGWSTNPAAANGDYQPSDIYDQEGNATLYAIWEEEAYILKYWNNGIQLGDNVQVPYTNNWVTLDSFEKAGYDFRGWSTTGDNTVEYEGGDSIQINKDTSLYAVFEMKKYKIIYDANGGDDAPATVEKYYGTPVEIAWPTTSSNRPSRDRHTFKGWSTDATALVGDIDYGQGKVYDGSRGDITLYAVWQGDTYYVEYDANDGTGAPGTQSETIDNDIRISSVTPTREGYDFIGWSENPDDTNIKYNPDDIYTGRVNLKLYAIWSIREYTVNYDVQGGTPEIASQTKKHGENIRITNTIPTKAFNDTLNYLFYGWSETPNSDNAQYTSNELFTENRNVTLYAVWAEPGSTDGYYYRVIYNLQGGDNGPIDQIGVTGEPLVLTATAPKRTGYKFLGWSTNKDATTGNSNYSEGKTYVGTDGKDLNLYAIWQEIADVTLTINPNGGEWNDSTLIQSFTMKYQEEKAIGEPSIDPAKYTFNGWEITSGDAQVVEKEYTLIDTVKVLTVIMGEQSSSIKATYKPVPHTLTYNANGGTGAPEAIIKNYDETFNLSSTIPTREGYNFMGWSTTSTATTAEYPAGASFTMPEYDVTLYAVWQLKTYTISYDANGGSGAPGSQTKTHGVNLTLSSTAPTREGYNFLGWGTSSTATAAAYQPGDTYTANGNVTLYAVWSIKKYTVSYNANGGSGAPGSQNKIHGVELTLSSTTPTREGYNFKGWGTSSTDTTADYQPGGKYTANQAIELFAIWELKTYTISYNANGGSGAPGSQTKTHGVNLTLSSTTPTREGYDFLGWGTSSSASTIAYQPGDTYTTNASITLYALWSQKTYTVTYNANGGSGAPSSQTKTHGINLTLSSTTPTRAGYNFKGWGTSTTDTTADYQPGATYTSNANITLYAIWDIKTYTVLYDANGGSGAPAAQTKTHGVNLTLSSTKPTRSGYTFQGWGTSSTDTTADYQPGATYSTNAGITLYAIWTKTTYTVSYNANGGSGAPAAQTKTHGENLTLSSTKPTRTGYTFQGWGTSTTDTTADYQPSGTYTSNASITLYAIWTKTTYTVSYNANGGSGAPGSQTKTHGEDLTLSATTPTRSGYTFQGWGTSTTDTTADYQPSGTYSTNADITLYAIWTKTTYTVSYNANGGSGAPGSQTKTHGENLTLSSTAPTRSGYTFQGWGTSTTDTTADYQPGGTYTANAGITLYAIWSINTYTVSYNANGGSGAPDAQTKTHGVELTLSSKVPTRSGYTFKGWGISTTDTTADYQPGGKYTANAGITLYAIWEQVISVTSVTLSPSSAQWVQKGNTKQFTATVAPSNATNSTVTWTSSDTSIATVDSTGKVTTKAAGRVQITATAGGKSASVYVYVYNAVLGAGYQHNMYDSAGGSNTGAILAGTGGAPMILKRYSSSSSYYQMLYTNNTSYSWGSWGAYLNISSTSASKYWTYFDV